jgi:hypothetical protein
LMGVHPKDGNDPFETACRCSIPNVESWSPFMLFAWHMGVSQTWRTPFKKHWFLQSRMTKTTWRIKWWGPLWLGNPKAIDSHLPWLTIASQYRPYRH